MMLLMRGLRRAALCSSCLLVLLLSVRGGPSAAQTPRAPSNELVTSVEQAAVRALSFTQGDRASLVDAREDFTEAAWSHFLGELEGWLDPEGAPGFSSAFMPSGPALNASLMDGSVRLTIPGGARASFPERPRRQLDDLVSRRGRCRGDRQLREDRRSEAADLRRRGQGRLVPMRSG